MRSVAKMALMATIAGFSVACGPPKITTLPQSSAPSSAPPPTRELSGDYKVTGTDAGGNPAYTGALTIRNEGDGYRFRWTTTQESHDGVGVQMGDAVAVSYARTGGGKGCGVVLYRLAPDGGLTGRIARWGEYMFGSETATRVDGTGFEGTYEVKGSTAAGEQYTGALKISKNGDGYLFEWKGTSKPFVAFGTWQGPVAAASFGGKQCSFMLFDVEPDGDLDGHWGGQKSLSFGTEIAERQ